MTDRARPDMTPEEVLAAAVAVVARGRSPEEDVGALLELTTKAVGAERGAVFLWDTDRDSLALASSYGFGEGAAATLEAAVAGDPEHPIARAAHDQVPWTGTVGTSPGGPPWTEATVPLRVAHDGVEEPIGALAVSLAGEQSMSPGLAVRLSPFADLVAIAVDRTRLTSIAGERSDWAERISHMDALTGLANARTLSRILELEVARAGRQGTDLSVVLFDVDGLAAANAADGHAAGDSILREVAAVLAETVRLVDTVARWGGDEFLLVAPGPAGLTVARRVLDAVAGLPPIGGRAASVSAGAARFPENGTTPDELVAAATAALATAKGSGPGTLAAALSIA